jgi:hypothetical protein
MGIQLLSVVVALSFKSHAAGYRFFVFRVFGFAVARPLFL